MKPNNLNDSNSKPLTDEKHLSLEQIPPENFPLLLDAQKTKSDKLAEIAIFKGACQKLSELSQLVEFLKAYTLRVIVEIGTLRGGTFWVLCQLAEPDGTIVGSIPFWQIHGEGRFLIRECDSRTKWLLSNSTTQAGIIER